MDESLLKEKIELLVAENKALRCEIERLQKVKEESISVPLWQYGDFIVAKQVAGVFETLIHNKRISFSGLSFDEIRLIDEMYFSGQGANE